MVTDWLTVVLVGGVALLVAAGAARRAGEHAERRSGRRVTAQAHRRGPLGAVADLIDGSIAMYAIRRRLGRSTATLAERRAAAARAAAMARADEIRRQRMTGVGRPPADLVVAGTAAASSAPDEGPDRQAHVPPVGREVPSTARAELLLATVAIAAVLVVVVAIWPRPPGGVLSATGTPPGAASPQPTTDLAGDATSAPPPTPETTP